MLTADQIQALRDKAGQLMDPVVEFLIADIAQRVSEAGQLTSTAAYQVWRAQQLGLSQKQLKKELQKRLKVSASKVEQLLTQAAEVGYNFDINRFPFVQAVSFDENTGLQQIIKSAVELAQDDLSNITQTIGFVTPTGQAVGLTEAYQQTCDYAFQKVSGGGQDYISAVREAIRNLAEKGIQTIDYESGVHTSLEAAVRRNMMGVLGLMDEKINQQNHDDLGCDGWEISAHHGSAPDHEPFQGKQYRDAEYKRLNGSLHRRIGTLNCGHSAMGIIFGVNDPQYTAEELEEMRRENEEGITYEGKHYTLYEATQRQRSIERAMRKQKHRILIDEKLDDAEKLQWDQIRYVRQREEYKRFSDAAGLRMQRERAEVLGFGPKSAIAAEKTTEIVAKQANSMYDIGSTEENIKAWMRDLPIRKKIGSEQYPLKIYRGRQNKHIPGTNEFKQYQKHFADIGEYGPARLVIDTETAQKLIDQYHGSGILLRRKDGTWNEKELITVHPDAIGISVNNLTGAEVDTTVFTIHYSKKGTHIVPSYPSKKGAKAKE